MVASTAATIAYSSDATSSAITAQASPKPWCCDRRRPRPPGRDGRHRLDSEAAEPQACVEALVPSAHGVAGAHARAGRGVGVCASAAGAIRNRATMTTGEELERSMTADL